MAKEKTVKVVNKGAAGGVYFLGVIGSAFYTVSVADGFGSVLVALFKALFWPAFLVNRVFELLQI
jgi:hypothetical protein